MLFLLVYIKTVTIVSGQEANSNNCFAVVMSDEMPSTIEKVKMEKVNSHSSVSMIKTVNENFTAYARLVTSLNFYSLNFLLFFSQSATFFDESKVYSNPSDMFFTNLRKNHPESALNSEQAFQSWFNDQVVRKTEGKRMLEKCVEELRTYTTS